MATKRKAEEVPTELLGSVYAYLAKEAPKAAKVFLNDTKFDTKIVRANVEDIEVIYTRFKSSNKRPAPSSKPSTPAAKKAESSSSDDSSSEDEKPAAKKPTTPAASASKASTSTLVENNDHKIFIKGLPWVTEESKVRDFFKSCGKIKSVEFPVDADGRASGTAYVAFSARSEVDKALELDGQIWPGTERWLKILDGKSAIRVSTTKPEGCDTVFVGNLPFDVEEDQLRELFASCGEVASIRFATAPEDGSFKGFGHVSFADGSSTDSAVKLSGTNINGRNIRVDYAPPRQRAEGGGRGGPGRGGRGAGGRAGRGGRGDAVVNKNKGTIAPSSGKKMTFDD